jgi:RNA polymerase sigma factor (sigma-70 family)
MRTEDGYLVEKCLNGEPESFGFLVDKYRGSIFAFAYSKLRNFHDAEDITQEVFLKAFQKLRALKRWDNFRAWLYSITSNLCNDWIRKRTKRPDCEFIKEQERGILDRSAMNSYQDGLWRESLHEAMDSLPETDRTVLTLYYLGGMNSVEIAQFLGASPTAIRQRLSRARTKLKEEVLDMISETYEQHRLPAIFTFYIVEAIKNIKIHPAPLATGLPFGLSSAVGIVLTVLSLCSHFSVLNPKDFPIVSELPDETTVMETGEIPVDVLRVSDMRRISRISPIYGNRGRGDGGAPGFPDQNALLMAPGGEGAKFPEKPSARLGKGTISQVTYSPDGKVLAVAGSRGIWLYDADNLNEVGLLEGHTSIVACVAFSPDGKILASGGWDSTICLWDVAGQKQVGLLQGHTEVFSVAFSPDGKALASSSGGEIRLWDVAEQKQVGVLRGHIGQLSSIVFSPDGKALASGGMDKTVCLWDVAGQKQVGVLKGHTDWVWSIAFSPDGKTLASGSGDATVRLWDVAGQKQIGLLQGHTDGVLSVVFSPDGKTLASGGGDATVRLWDVAGQKRVGFLGHTGGVLSVAFRPDGKTLASVSGDATVHFWDVAGQKQMGVLKEHTGAVESVIFSPDGKTLASGGMDKTVRLWDVAEQKQVGVLQGHTDWVWSIAFSPDGKTLASGSYDKTVRLWDVAGQNQVGLLQGHTWEVWSVAFSPDGKTLASGSNDRTIRLWDVTGKNQIGLLQGHTGGVNSVAFSPDSKTLASSGGDDKTVRLWDVAGQKQIGLLKGHTAPVTSIAFSPDGKTLASGGMDKTVRLWNVAGQNQVGLLQGHTGYVSSVAFSPDGKMLASGSWDNTIRFWDVAGQNQVGLLQGHTGVVLSVAISPYGRWLASGGDDGTVLLWEVNLPVPSGKSIEPKGKRPMMWGEVKRTALYQNFPNPFNPETWIPFSLSEQRRVNIRIYSSRGHLVRTLNLGQKPAGEYLSREQAAHWDGRNDNGEPVASGVYFYTMGSGGIMGLRKMVVIR